jgi:hypothetical protein
MHGTPLLVLRAGYACAGGERTPRIHHFTYL